MKSFSPTPRMKGAIAPLLPPCPGVNWILGAICPICVTVPRPRLSRPEASTALTAIGTSCNFSSRRRAVTTISPADCRPASAGPSSCRAAAIAGRHSVPNAVMPKSAFLIYPPLMYAGAVQAGSHSIRWLMSLRSSGLRPARPRRWAVRRASGSIGETISITRSYSVRAMRHTPSSRR